MYPRDQDGCWQEVYLGAGSDGDWKTTSRQEDDYFPQRRLGGLIRPTAEVRRHLEPYDVFMFGAEPQKPWTKEEQTEFEEHAAARLNDAKSSALKAGIAFLGSVAIIAPFSVVQRLQAYWPRARFFVFSAELLFLWFVVRVGFVWSSWQSSREVRREYASPALADFQADYIRAHKHCIENRSEVEASTLCGCFYCMSIYPPSEIVDWIDDREAMTADCPRCEIDAVIGSASGFPITAEFLNRMNAHWFEGRRSGEHA